VSKVPPYHSALQEQAASLMVAALTSLPFEERRASQIIVEELGKVLPAVYRGIDAPPSGAYGRVAFGANGVVEKAWFNIFRAGQVENWARGYVGDLVLEREPSGSYAIRFMATDERDLDERFQVGPTVSAPTFVAADLRAPLTRLFAPGTGVRESVAAPRNRPALE
jgi:hypothetical protein